MEAVRRVLDASGPLTGAELHAAVGGEVFGLWKVCRQGGDVLLRTTGRRYVRLDRTVEGFARLSPSILREFATYTVVGLPGQEDAVAASAHRLEARTRAISLAKRRAAERFTTEVLDSFVHRGDDLGWVCVLLAGDVVHGMAHDVPRPESSTGVRVDGSDLDLVVLVADDAPDSLVNELDASIRQRKWLYLRNPMIREEVDYVVKRSARLQEQAAFETFAHLVACKVFDEAQFLRGNRSLHEAGRRALAERGVPERLRALEAQAIANRPRREQRLLSIAGDRLPSLDLQFYGVDEAAEFEHLT